jgi:hypothetical protein
VRSLQKLAKPTQTLSSAGGRSIFATAIAAALVGTLAFAPSATAKRPPKTTVPNTTIDSGPANGSTIADPTPTFSFSSNRRHARFECKVDSASYGGCVTPFTTATLAGGSHAFYVRAIDAAGAVDPTPASRTFTVSTAGSDEPAPPPPPPPPESSTTPTEWRRFASFERDLSSGTDLGWTVPSGFAVSRSGEVGGTDGAYAAKIVTSGGSSGCSCPRMKFEDGFSHGVGDEVWISGSWYVTDPSKLNWSRFMNLGHWEGDGDPDNWLLSLESTSPGTMQVSGALYSNPDPKHVILPPRPIPADQWFRVDLHFRLSPTDGQALTEWYVNGQLAGQTTRRNMLRPTPLHFFNAGLSYFWSGNGNTTVYFDAARLAP